MSSTVCNPHFHRHDTWKEKETKTTTIKGSRSISTFPEEGNPPFSEETSFDLLKAPTNSKSTDPNLSYFQKAQLYLNNLLQSSEDIIPLDGTTNQLEEDLQELSSNDIISSGNARPPSESLIIEYEDTLSRKSEDFHSMAEKFQPRHEVLDKKKATIRHHLSKESPMEWKIRKRKGKTKAKPPKYHCTVFYTKSPGYRIELRAKVERAEGNIYFSIRMLQGVFDGKLKGPFVGQFKIQVPRKYVINKEKKKSWVIPSGIQGVWKKGIGKSTVIGRPSCKKNHVYSEWAGPFDVSDCKIDKKFCLQIEFVQNNHKRISTPKEITPKESTLKEITPKEITPKEITSMDGNLQFSTGQFKIQIHPEHVKDEKDNEVWTIPSAESGIWEIGVEKQKKGKRVYSEWIGPFDISDYVNDKNFHLQVELMENDSTC